MPFVTSVRAVLEDVMGRWAVDSQQAARRNAMVASTALAARRKETSDVEDFLAARDPDAPPTTTPTTAPTTAPTDADAGTARGVR